MKQKKYCLLKQEGRAKRGEFHTVHGTVQTPVFMNVGTVAAIKGAVSTEDLESIGTQIELSNTYHLHVRREIQSSDKWVVCTVLCRGTDQSSLIPVDFRFFL